ncbi:MAG: pilus assembly protein PilM [Gammaproteobacteria bacterium]|nr:pilus assembly protein PilM [Gammaproteobacteria bacterium]
MDFTLPFLTKKSNKVLGMDISSMAVKILELTERNHHYHVESYAVAAIPSQAIVENDIKDPDAVAEAIQLAYARSESTLNSVATALPSSSIITKILQVDANISESELSEHIQLEAGRYIPYPLDEVALDFSILGMSEREPGKRDVLVVAARSEQVESRAEVIRRAGLTPKIIDVESYAVERAFSILADQLSNKGINQTIAVVDIGSIFTTITILHNLHIVYTRDELFGGRQLTEAIQRRYGVSYEQAGFMKKQREFADDYVPEVLNPFLESLIPLIRRTLQLFFSSSRFTEVEHILLAGGGAMIPGLSKLIQERLSTSCTVANPLSDMSINSRINIASITADSSSLLTCCGLALRSFDHG